MESNNYYSQLSDKELIDMYNYIVSEKNRIERALYYINVEMENRKNFNNTTPGQVANTTGGFKGASQFQKRVDEVVKKELKLED